MSGILIKNGRVIDPFSNRDEQASLFISDGAISETGSAADACGERADTVIDAAGMWITPSFIDLHCHIREPGFAYKERMIDTLRAAASGGYTTICTMPNLEPAIDHGPMVEHIKATAEKHGLVDVHVIGAITEGRRGEALSQIGELYEAGAVGLSDDGSTVMDSRLMMMGMNYAKSFGFRIICHCEDMNLAKGGSMNSGRIANEMGLGGIPNAAEDIIISRDILLSGLTGTPVHIAHVSTSYGVELIRQAKQRGIAVTAEAAPHHFTLTEEAVMGFNANAKVNPPLRKKADIDAVKQGLADGTIDAIATDHAPHAAQEKEKEFDLAPFGMVGLETALPLSLRLVEEGLLTPLQLIHKLTSGPAAILPLNRKGLGTGSPANITIINPAKEWRFGKDTMAGKAQNSPFSGWNLKGRAVMTINKGKIIWKNQG